jgi:hypothetical protein
MGIMLFFESVGGRSQSGHYLGANLRGRRGHYAHFRLRRHRLSGGLASGIGADGDHCGRRGPGCTCGIRRAAIIAAADSRFDVATAGPNGQRAGAVARPRRRGGGSAKSPRLISAASHKRDVLFGLNRHTFATARTRSDREQAFTVLGKNIDCPRGGRRCHLVRDEGVAGSKSCHSDHSQLIPKRLPRQTLRGCGQ